MNVLLSCIGKRGYIASYFREVLPAGSRVIGTSNTRWTPGFAECDAGYVLPSIDCEGYPEALLSLCQREKIDLILSLFDPDVFVLSQMKEQFRAIGTFPLIPDARSAALAFDKFETFKFLKRHEIATPLSFETLQEAREAIDSALVALPMYVKPRRGFGSRATFRCESLDQLSVFMSLGEDMIAQQAISGRMVNVDVFADGDGSVVSCIPWERHLSTYGETERAETIECPDVIDVACRASAKLAFVGPADVDMYIDENGKIGILEFNLRFGGGYPVSHLAGAAFPAKALGVARGDRLQPCIGDYRRQVFMTKRLDILGGSQADLFERVLHVVDVANAGVGDDVAGQGVQAS